MPLASFLSRLTPLGRVALGFAVASVVMLILMGGRPRFTNAAQPRGGWPAALAIQFAGSVQDVDLILGDAPSPDREVMRFKLYLDFVFIPIYTGLLVTLSWLAMRRGRWPKLAAGAAIVCAAGASVFDVAENLATLQIVNTPLQATSQAMIDLVTVTSDAKWISAGVAIAFLLVSRYGRF